MLNQQTTGRICFQTVRADTVLSHEEVVVATFVAKFDAGSETISRKNLSAICSRLRSYWNYKPVLPSP